MHAVFLPGHIKVVPLSEDFANYNAYLEVLSTTFIQCILSADAFILNKNVLNKRHVNYLLGNE